MWFVFEWLIIHTYKYFLLILNNLMDYFNGNFLNDVDLSFTASCLIIIICIKSAKIVSDTYLTATTNVKCSTYHKS